MLSNNGSPSRVLWKFHQSRAVVVPCPSSPLIAVSCIALSTFRHPRSLDVRFPFSSQRKPLAFLYVLRSLPAHRCVVFNHVNVVECHPSPKAISSFIFLRIVTLHQRRPLFFFLKKKRSKSKGRPFLSTPFRWSFLPSPHVAVWSIVLLVQWSSPVGPFLAHSHFLWTIRPK